MVKAKNKLLSAKEIDEIFAIFAHHNPEPKIELNYVNNFTLLIAVLLSAQATDKMVNICTEELFANYSSPHAFLLLGYDGIVSYIKKIGLYRNKAKNIIKTCHILINQHNGIVPNNFDDLVALPGVGRKTADVVLNTGFGQSSVAVDRHIFRIVHRIGITDAPNVDKVADDLLKIVDKKWLKYCHHWLVLHGRYVCKARKPNCDNCIIKNKCKLYQSLTNLSL